MAEPTPHPSDRTRPVRQQAPTGTPRPAASTPPHPNQPLFDAHHLLCEQVADQQQTARLAADDVVLLDRSATETVRYHLGIYALDRWGEPVTAILDNAPAADPVAVPLRLARRMLARSADASGPYNNHRIR